MPPRSNASATVAAISTCPGRGSNPGSDRASAPSGEKRPATRSLRVAARSAMVPVPTPQALNPTRSLRHSSDELLTPFGFPDLIDAFLVTPAVEGRRQPQRDDFV